MKNPITLEFNFDHKSEIEWTAKIVFKKFLGLDIELKHLDDPTKINIINNSHVIETKNIFFKLSNNCWLDKDILNYINFSDLTIDGIPNVTKKNIKIFFGQPKIKFLEKKTTLDCDIFGMIFFIISGYYEAISLKKDKHDRFAFEFLTKDFQNLLKEPSVDVYVNFLFRLMKKNDPTLNKKNQYYDNFISCDVDNPYGFYIDSFSKTTRKFFGDLLKRKDLVQANLTLANFFMSKFKNYSYDELNTFNFMMDINEFYGNTMTFFFLSDNSKSSMDGFYSIDESRIQKLIKRIVERGHNIGLHGSYLSYNNIEYLINEKNLLCDILEKTNSNQTKIGIRQHYLRWSAKSSPRLIDKAGFDFDSTVGFADHIGFRRGTSHNYSMYDLENRVSLKILEKPLIVMEDSMFGKEYMNISDDNDFKLKLKKMKKSCVEFGGEFNFLWHNSTLKNKYYKDLYKESIRLVSN